MICRIPREAVGSSSAERSFHGPCGFGTDARSKRPSSSRSSPMEMRLADAMYVAGRFHTQKLRHGDTRITLVTSDFEEAALSRCQACLPSQSQSRVGSMTRSRVDLRQNGTSLGVVHRARCVRVDTDEHDPSRCVHTPRSPLTRRAYTSTRRRSHVTSVIWCTRVSPWAVRSKTVARSVRSVKACTEPRGTVHTGVAEHAAGMLGRVLGPPLLGSPIRPIAGRCRR